MVSRLLITATNLTNANVVREKLFEKDRRHINTTSDSEVLLNVLAHEIDTVRGNVTAEDVFRAVANVHRTIRGAYAVTAMIIGHGMIAFATQRYSPALPW